MQNINRIDVSYDAIADVLYMMIEKGVITHNIEKTAGLVLRYDLQTKSPIGATVLDYREYWLAHKPILTSRLATFFNVSAQEAGHLLARIA